MIWRGLWTALRYVDFNCNTKKVAPWTRPQFKYYSATIIMQRVVMITNQLQDFFQAHENTFKIKQYCESFFKQIQFQFHLVKLTLKLFINESIEELWFLSKCKLFVSDKYHLVITPVKNERLTTKKKQYRISEWAGFQVWKFLHPKGGKILTN